MSKTAPRSTPPVAFYDAATYLGGESVGLLMKRIVQSIVGQVDKRLNVHGLTSAQWGPLMRLNFVGPSTVADLARWLQIDAGAMTRLLDRLDKKGLCKRVRSSADRRVVNVELTAEGRASIVEVPTVLAAVLNDHLAGFSKTEWQALKAYLQRMDATGEALRTAA